jgi:putative salt-induced outer membrane protein YdiY
MTVLLTAIDARAQENETFTDRIYLKNGDRITGNIKELDRGKLRIKTRTMDTIYINWIEVESVESTSYLRVTHTDGTFRSGRVQKSDTYNSVTVQTVLGPQEISNLEIASMKPLRVGESFWHRLEGDASAGIDYKKASDILLVNVASNLRLREEKYEIAFNFNWNETQRTENNDSSRAELGAEFTRLLGDRWFWKASAGLERNQELGLDLRTIVAGSAGKYFLQTPTMRFEVNAGIAASIENRTDDTSQDSVEGVIRSSFDLFQLNIPITRLTASVSVFPGITESGRIRVNTDVTLRNELWRDFFWDLTFYSTYDNRPVSEAERSDYGIITSLGASF